MKKIKMAKVDYYEEYMDPTTEVGVKENDKTRHKSLKKVYVRQYAMLAWVNLLSIINV